MAVKQFDSIQYGYCADTNENVRFGSFKASDSGPLVYIKPFILIKGVTGLGGSETMQMKIYGDSDYSNLLYSSTTRNVSDFGVTGTTNYLSWQRFDFNNENINKDITYYLSCQVSNYTPVSGSFEIYFIFDYPDSINTNLAGSSNFSQHGLRYVMYQKLPRFT